MTATPRHTPLSPLRRGEKGFLRVMGNPFLVEVLAVNAKEVWVSFPGEGYPLEGMGAQLEFHTPAGYVLYHTQVVRGPRAEGDGVVLERTESSDERQHRRHWRVPADFPVVLQPEAGTQRYTALLHNLSAGGMHVRTHAEMALPCDLHIAMPLGDDAVVHELRGRVLHRRDMPHTTPGPPIEYGVTFTEVPKESRRALLSYLYEAIRALYPEEVRALYPGAHARPRK